MDTESLLIKQCDAHDGSTYTLDGEVTDQTRLRYTFLHRTHTAGEQTLF